MSTLTLSTAQRKDLRAQAHHLEPVVMIGNDGLSSGVIKETGAALDAHGLIKIRVLGDDREARELMATALCEKLSAALVQHIGKLLVLYRPMPKKEHAPDPDRKPGPRLAKIVKPSRSRNHRPTVKKMRVLGNERITAGGNIKRKRSAQTSRKKSTG